MNRKPNDDANNNKTGNVIIEGGYATLRYERYLPYPPETVWKAITDPKELAAWFNTKASIDAPRRDNRFCHRAGRVPYNRPHSGLGPATRL